MTIRKELSEMSLEELWELFPIFLVEHNEKWADYYNEMERNLREMLPAGAIDRISHIGSTAIQNIWAKNIVDIMVEISHSADMKEVAHILEQNGFTRCLLKRNASRSIKIIQKMVSQRKFITFISGSQVTMMNYIFAIT